MWWPVTRWDYLLRQDNDAELWLWFFHIGLLFLSSHLHAVLVDKLEAHLSDDYVLRHVVLVLRGSQEWVHRQFHGLIEDLWDNPLEKHAGGFEAWVGIHFNQVEVKVLVEHKVEAHELERVVIISTFASTDTLAAHRRSIARPPSRLKDILDGLFDPRHYRLQEAYVFLLEEVLVEVDVADLVCRLELSVVV